MRSVGLRLLRNSTPTVPGRAKACWFLRQCPTQCLFVDISFEKKRLVEDLSRLLNDIRCGSFIIVGLPGKLPKASAYFLFSKEKIKELSLLKWSEIRKLGDRQDSYGRLF